jgi:hypothetical protein
MAKSKAQPKPSSNGSRPVIVCTEHRGVFFGYSADTSGDVIHGCGYGCGYGDGSGEQ